MTRVKLATADEAERIVKLWRSGHFDTHDIGRLLRLPEATVWRTLQAVRDMARIVARGGAAMKRILRHLGDFLFGGPRPRPPEKPQKPLPEILFIPVIFANGRDDDTEGVKAFLEHRPVMLAGRLIAPENNKARIEGLSLRFSCGQLVLMHK